MKPKDARLNASHRKVLRELGRAPHGLTDDELSYVTMLGRNAQAARIELAGMHLVRASVGMRETTEGRSETVWLLT